MGKSCFCWPGLAFLLAMGTHVAAASGPKITCTHSLPEGTSLHGAPSPQLGSHIISAIITQLPCGLCPHCSPLYSSRGIFSPTSFACHPTGAPTGCRGQGPHPQPGTRESSCLNSVAHCPLTSSHTGFQQCSTSRSSPNPPYNLVMCGLLPKRFFPPGIF